MIKRVINFFKKHEHEWTLINTRYDPNGFLDSFPTRFVHFKCNGCGKEHKETRWAFVEGSGALTFFLGKDWF